VEPLVKQLFRSDIRRPVGTLPKEFSCGRSGAFAINLRPCQPPQFSVQDDGSSIPNPNAQFVQATCETDFNTGHVPSATDPCGGPLVSFSQGRNRFRGPSYFNTDLAVVKSTKLPGWEGGTLALGFQFFNLLNHPKIWDTHKLDLRSCVWIDFLW